MGIDVPCFGLSEPSLPRTVLACELMWQIGVDVVETARGGGIGRALVSRLTALILDSGRVPYYSTAVSNIRSRAVALSLGYWPAWTELYVRDRT